MKSTPNRKQQIHGEPYDGDEMNGPGAQQAACAAPSSHVPASRWAVLVLVGAAQLMVVLDVTIVNMALPSAEQALQFSDGDRQWIITAYALTLGSLLLLGGNLGDLFGRKWTFVAGLLGFARGVGCRRRSAVIRCAGSCPGLAGIVRGAAGPFGAVTADPHLSQFTGPSEGLWDLQCDRRQRNLGGAAARRAAD